MTSPLRAAVLGFSAAVLWWPLTVVTGVVAAALGAVAGALAGDARGSRVHDARELRAGSLALLACAVAGALAGLSQLVVQTDGVAALLGPTAAVHVSEALFAFGLTGAGVLCLRLLAARRPALSVFEIGAVATAFVVSLAAHREGMIHRPLALGDLAWSRGIDPTFLFLVFGGLCVLLLAVLLVAEERRSRLPLHFGVLIVVALLLTTLVRFSGLPQPRAPQDLGLTGDAKQEQTRGESEGRGQMNDLDFKDDYNKDSGRSPVAVVLLRDDYSPPIGAYYFRQTAFTRYNGRRLVQSVGDSDVDRDLVHQFPVERLEVPWQPPEPERRLSLRTTTGLLLDHIKPFALDSPLFFEPAENPEGLRFQRVYDSVSLVGTTPYKELLGQRPGDADWSEREWEAYTEMPADPRYGELARELTEPLLDEYRSDPLAQAMAIKLHLDREGIYSRKSEHADSEDPAASFLFGDMTGYCVHFAHASVYMYRSIGIPARVAAGYAVPEANRAGGSAIMIRGLNAHAWPEIYLEDTGWVVVDPAPMQTLEEPIPRADATLQRMLGEMLREQAQEEMQTAESNRQFFTARDALRFVALLLLAAMLLCFAVKLYRALAPRLVRREQHYRVAYRAVLDRLAEVGLQRRFGESRERFAARADTIAPSFAALTRAHLAQALGRRAAPAGDELRQLAARTRAEIWRQVPAWRTCLGLLNPWAWLSAR